MESQNNNEVSLTLQAKNFQTQCQGMEKIKKNPPHTFYNVNTQ